MESNILNTLNEKFTQLFDKLGITKPEPIPPVENDLRLSTADGKTIIIRTDSDQASVNDKVRMEDGNIENGDYTMPDGDVLTVVDSVITVIKTKEGEKVNELTQNDVILQLQTEVTSLRSDNDTLVNQVNQLTGNINLLLENIESSFVAPVRDASFVKKDKNTQVSDSANFDEALARIKEKETKK